MEKYIVIFFVYSFAGWFLESVGGILNVKKFVNRGFLIGPYCPVYGTGVVLITRFLEKYSNDVILLFFMSALICGILEYITSYVMEKIFHARWWDYHKSKFNLNGRICLETLILFGIFGILILKISNPFILGIVENIPIKLLYLLLNILVIILVIDVCISFSVILKFRKNVKKVEKEVRDNTDEIVRKVKEENEKRYEDFKYKIGLSLYEIKTRVRYRSSALQKRIERYRLKKQEERKNTIEKLRKLSEKINKKSNEFKTFIEDRTKLVKDKYVKKNILSHRLFRAFPNMEVKTIDKNDKSITK